LFREIFFARHNLVPRYYALLSTIPGAITHCGGIRSGETV
jgi:hypothetical protein